MSTILPVSEILPEPILNGILKSGIVITGNPSCGKTNALKIIASEIIRNYSNFIQVKIVDSASNLRWSFDKILYQKINDQTRVFYDGNENILFDINLVNEDDILNFVRKIILTDYLRARKNKEENNGYVNKWIVYFFEESQNLLGSYSLMRKNARVLLKLLSEGRNFGLSYILTGQRLAEIATQATERRTSFLFGFTIGANNINKIKRMVGNDSTIPEDVKKLQVEKGEFIFYDGKSSYDFHCPLWKPISNGDKPIEWIPSLNGKIWQYRDGVRMI